MNSNGIVLNRRTELINSNFLGSSLISQSCEYFSIFKPLVHEDCLYPHKDIFSGHMQCIFSHRMPSLIFSFSNDNFGNMQHFIILIPISLLFISDTVSTIYERHDNNTTLITSDRSESIQQEKPFYIYHLLLEDGFHYVGKSKIRRRSTQKKS